MKRSLFFIALLFLLFLLPMSIAYAEFGLMLGSFKDQKNAQNYLDNFRDRYASDYNAFLEEVQMPGKGTWYRVCLGPFVNRENAIKKQKLLQSGGHDSVVISVTPSEKNIAVRDEQKIKLKSLSRPTAINRGFSKKSPPLISANASESKDIHGQLERSHEADKLSHFPEEGISSPSIQLKDQNSPRGGGGGLFSWPWKIGCHISRGYRENRNSRSKTDES